MPMRRLLLPFLFLIPAGCYHYEPVTDPRPGMDVRARLQTEAAVRRSTGLDEPVVRFDGRVVDASPDQITIDVLVLRDPSMFTSIEIRDTVSLSRAEIASITQRRISTSRSLIFAGALGAGSYLVVRGIAAIVGGNEGGGDDPGPVFTSSPASPRRAGPVLQFSLPVP